MRTIGVSVLAAVAAAGCGGPAPGPPGAAGEAPAVLKPDPPVAVPKDAPPVLAGVLGDANRKHRRVAGARLTVAAKWVKDAGAIRFEWAIDYAGPRRPFTIATPGRGADEMTGHFWYVRWDRAAGASACRLAGGRGEGLPADNGENDRGGFSVAADGQPVAGRMETGVSGLPRPLGGPPGPGDPPLWVQLEYAPTDRGDGFDWPFDPATRSASRGPAWAFDAWTGYLWSPVVEVGVE